MTAKMNVNLLEERALHVLRKRERLPTRPVRALLHASDCSALPSVWRSRKGGATLSRCSVRSGRPNSMRFSSAPLKKSPLS